MNAKNIARLRRARQTRIRIRENGAVRLTVHRSNEHIYAQITSPGGDKVLATASSVEKDVRGQLKSGGSRKAAELVGQRIAAKAKEKGSIRWRSTAPGTVPRRIKALAEAARSGGLKF
jgi:large subunit ribosomal protein L18